jgi:FlgD Ig-like domain
MRMKNILLVFLLLRMLTSIPFPTTAYAQRQIMSDYTGYVFPKNHALNTRIDSLPVHPNSNNYIAAIGTSTALHPDFGTSWDDGGTLYPIGIPYNVVGALQPFVPLVYDLYGDESDPGPWPIPQNPFIETVFDWRDPTDGDRHMLIVDSSSHILYETGNFYKGADGIWHGGCGARFYLDSNNLRQDGWTSADAAGLPIFPLLIRYDEVDRALVTGSEISHAFRFTVQHTQQAYVWPARHYASSSTDTNRPPMGLRFRLKASVDISGFSSRMQFILRTMKKYGLIISDNGSNWFFQGTHDDRWDDADINTLKNLHGSDFEAVDISSWMARPGFDPNSAAVPPASASFVPSNVSIVPSNFSLYQNFPNPFNPSTTISYTVGTQQVVSIKIFDILGREIKTLLHEVKAAGTHAVQWDGTDSNGYTVSGGIYFYRLQSSNGYMSTKKLVFLK